MLYKHQHVFYYKKMATGQTLGHACPTHVKGKTRQTGQVKQKGMS
jgi:hypothetical protein